MREASSDGGWVSGRVTPNTGSEALSNGVRLPVLTATDRHLHFGDGRYWMLV
jgi:hypothetical protein